MAEESHIEPTERKLECKKSGPVVKYAMDDASLIDYSVSEAIVQPLFGASNSSTLKDALENLIEVSKTTVGRSDLTSKNILPAVLQLGHSLPYPSAHHLLTLSLKLLRNLCAGEIVNQNSFIEQNGVGIISAVLRPALVSGSDHGLLRMVLQVLANVSLAGEVHQRALWHQFFPDNFVAFARVQSRETCDPLCMIIYTCCDGCPELAAELFGDKGLPIVKEIVRTTSTVGFGEDWLKLLLSICLEKPHFPSLFSELCPAKALENGEHAASIFSSEQAFLLNITSEILNEQICDCEVFVSNDFAVFVLEIFKKSVGVVDYVPKTKAGLPTGSIAIDVLGYSLTILKDICVQDRMRSSKDDSVDAVDPLLSSGLLELLLCLLRDLEPPKIIKKAMKQGENQEGSTSSLKPCPYKGFRRDIVAAIGNCTASRKHVRDEIRHRNGIFLLLQQCVIDEDNPNLREWGQWAVNNLLEGNAENQRVVSELLIQGSVAVPEIAELLKSLNFLYCSNPLDI